MATKKDKSFIPLEALSRRMINQPKKQCDVFYYALHHNYSYYAKKGKEESSTIGYYDEYGNRYNDVIDSNLDKQGIDCFCRNCGYKKLMSFEEFEYNNTCPDCSLELTPNISYDYVFHKETKKSNFLKSNIVFVYVGIVVIISIILGVLSYINETNKEEPPEELQLGDTIVFEDGEHVILSNPEIFGEKIYLKKDVDNGYRISVVGDYDKIIFWYKEYEAYYDQELKYWMWYNNYVKTPGVWQYWYEPICGIYAGCGWMEYDEVEKAFWINTDGDNWRLMNNTSELRKLYHIIDGATDISENK